MKKILLFIAGLIFTSLSMHAATGWYSDYIKINVSGAGTAGPTGWYWIGGNPGYATQLAGTNFGTASSLVITGCDMKYWSDTQDRTGGSFFYKIMTSDNTTQIIAPVETIWSQAYLGGNDYQGTTTVSINLFTGLSASTTYNLHVWAKHWGTGQGDNYLSNGGANYIATFTTPAAPVAYNVTGSGSYCEGGSGLAVGLDNSEAGTTYKLYKSTDLVTPVATVTPVAAGAFSFGTFAAGTYTATGTNAISTANMSGSAVISMDPLPLTGSILGSADVTEGDVLVPYTVSIAYATSYTWSYTGTGVTINGIGSAVTLDIAFGATSGSLKVTGHNACGDGAESSLAITVHLYIAPPTVFSVTGSGTYCEGSGGRSVGLDDSEAGVTYKLYKSTDLLTPIATVTPLVSGAFSFGTFSAGTYTATGTNAGGTTAMDGSAIIGEVMLPVASGSIVGPAHVTEGMTIDYSATVSYATNYSWNYSGTGVTINGNGSPNVSLDFAMGATSGQLSVSGSNSCGAIDLNLDITVITVPTSSTYFGTGNWGTTANWSDGIPGSSTIVTVTGNLNIDQDAQMSHFTIAPGGTTTVASGNDVVFEGDFTIQSNASGTGSFIGNNNNFTIVGDITVQRYIAGEEWHLISSPVEGTLSGMFEGKYLQTHDEGTNAYTDILTTDVPLETMKGFALYGGGTWNYNGIMNSGDIGSADNLTRTEPGANSGWNLVGNPYPSSISWNDCNTENLNEATYIHVDNTKWASFVNGVGNNGGTNFIAPGQGFFVQVTDGFSTGTLTMDDLSRVHHNTAFFKNTVNNLVRLQLSGNNYTDEAVVRFLPGATAEFDGEYDAYKLFADNTEASQLYTLGSTPLSINTLPETNTVPVAMRCGSNGVYTIAATEINDLQAVTLEDTKTGIFTDLLKDSYSFSSVAGENEQRFTLHFAPLSVNETENSFANIYSNMRTVFVDLKNNAHGDISIYTVAGQVVANKLSASGSNRIELMNPGNYIVKVISKESTMVRKVWIQ